MSHRKQRGEDNKIMLTKEYIGHCHRTKIDPEGAMSEGNSLEVQA